MLGLARGKVCVVPYSEEWPAAFASEATRMRQALAPWVVDIQHIGSTAVPGLAAKPIVDVMPGIRSLADADKCIAPLVALGYEYMGEYGIPGRHLFGVWRGDLTMYHVHMVEWDSPFWRRHLLFRDYLRRHPEARDEYGALKSRLALEFPGDRQAYMDGKEPLILDLNRRAEMEAEAQANS
jgi:GrpB-like predicted nucleotidyltransferase (UPF0157 family)